MKRDDTLWKAILEDIFDDFLRFFFPDADELFLLDVPFEYLDKELEQLFPPDQDAYAPRYVDKLVKVFTRQAGQPHEQWILVHIEVQGYKDATFAERMFQYYYRIFDKYHRPITAFAIFTGNHTSHRPHVYEQNYLGTQLRYQYNTYVIRDQSEAELLASSNPFALVVLTAKAALQARNLTDTESLNLKISLAKALLNSGVSRRKIRNLMNFLLYYVRLENPDANRKFDDTVREITQTNTTMGIEEFLLDRAKKEGIKQGREQGFEQAKRLLVAQLLTKTDFSDEQIADIAGVSAVFVNQIRTDGPSSSDTSA